MSRSDEELAPREAGRAAADMLAGWLAEDAASKQLTAYELADFWLGVCDGAVVRIAELRPEIIIRESFRTQ